MSKFVVNPNEYIFFEPDQVLTNDHLNQLFGYLDQQERWTRNKLIGMGIVCGFELTYNSKADAISISKGCGITSQGYLINKCQHHTYTHVINYTLQKLPKDLPFTCTNTPFYKPGTDTSLNIYQLLDAGGVAQRKPDPCADCLPPVNNPNPPAPANPPEPLSSVAGGLSDYVVVLFLEVQEKDLKNCDTQDCNNKGEKMVFAIRPLLVPKSFIKNSIGGVTKPAEIKLKRYNVPYTAITDTAQVLDGFLKLMEKDTLARIEDALSYCYTYTAAFFPDTPKSPFLASPGEYLRFEIERVIKQDPLLIQYCYDFINDLILAYYEFREAALCVNVACCADECKFPLHLVLGIAGTDTNKTGRDPYRQYFMKAAGGGCENNELSKLEFLLKRIEMMIRQFLNPFAEWRKMIFRGAVYDRILEPVRITPSQYEMFPLSERAIPYYYLMDTANKNLYQQWNFHKTVNGNATFNLSYNARVYSNDDSVTEPLLFDIEKNNFLRIEGHIGQQYKAMLTEISSLRQEYNLPFDVVAVSADMLNPLSKLPDCHVQDLETDYRLIVSDFACKVHSSFCLLAQLPFPADDKYQPYPGAESHIIPATKLPSPLVFGKVNYKKGDFLKTFCNPAKGAKTIGAEYLELLKNEKEFVELITKYITDSTQSGDTTLAAVYTYYRAVFYFIDAVERLMVILMTKSIATLDIDKSDSKFNAAYHNYLLRVGAVSSRGLQETEVRGETPTNAVMVGVDYIIAEEMILANACVDETLQTLKHEYLTRLRNYEQQLYFLNYFRKHPGLEHKGGVPKGGTFVLVYHEEEYNEWTVEKERGEAAKVTSTLSEVSLNKAQIETFLEYVNKCGKNPVSLEPIYKIFNPQPREKYNIPNGTVIADFYVPYMCCSDCAPVAYVIQPVDKRPTVYNVTGGGSRCINSDEKGYSVGLSHSEVDVSYQPYFTAEKLDAPDVKQNTVKAGAAVEGTGRAIDFGVKTRPGKYTVVGTNRATGMTSDMRGSATIALGAAPQVFKMASSQSAATGEYQIVLEGSELKVSYQLKNNESEINVAPMEGTGNKLAFPAQISPGTYTIAATSENNCESQMDGSLTIPNAPAPK